MPSVGESVRDDRAPCECPCGCRVKKCNRHVSQPLCWHCTEGSHHVRNFGGRAVAPADDGWTRLTEAEWAEAREHARLVMEMDEERGYENEFEHGDMVAHNENAYGAEYAASKALGLPRHWELFPKGYRNKDKRCDLGRRLDIKNTEHDHGGLWVLEHQPREWCYLLVPGAGRRYRMAGWMEGSELFDPERLHRAGETIRGIVLKKNTYIAEQHELHPLPLPEDA